MVMNLYIMIYLCYKRPYDTGILDHKGLPLISS